MLLKATKVLQTEMLFSNIFLSLWWPGGTLTDIINCAKGTRAAPDKQKASVKEMVVDNSTNNSSSNINKISVFGKGKTLFSRTQKIVKLNITTQIKILSWLLALDLAKKNFWGFQEISNLSFMYMKFVLTKSHFCNWYWSSNYWDFFNRKTGLNATLKDYV